MKGLTKLFEQREKFNKAFNIRSNNKIGFIKSEEFLLERSMMLEEGLEYFEACRDYDITEITDALADEMFLLIGKIKKHGFNPNQFQLVMDEVYRSNMSKLHNGKIVKNEAGKVVKPSTFSPPNISELLSDFKKDEELNDLGI
jgi:enolase